MRASLSVLVVLVVASACTAASPTSDASLRVVRERVLATGPSALTLPRSRHTATLLPSGKIWITGGNVLDAARSTELYDPQAGSFASGSASLLERLDHTATLLRTGEVLVTGGVVAGAATTATEIYTPETNTVVAGPPMAAARSGHTATMLADGRVLIAGGNSVAGAVEIFDPTTRTFTSAGSLAAARSTHTATRLPSGDVLLVGGTPGTSSPQPPDPVAEIFDPTTGTLHTAPGTLTPRADHTTTLLGDGTVLVAGGTGFTSGIELTRAELYVPASGQVTAVPASARTRHVALLLPSGKVVVAGGESGTTTIATIELFDPVAGTFDVQPETLGQTREAFTATLLPGGDVAFVGGRFVTSSPSKPNGLVATVEVYATAPSGLSSSAASLPLKAGSPRVAALADGKVAVIAGGVLPSTAIDVYDPATDALVAHADLAVGRTGHSATSLDDGTILIAGGVDVATAVDRADLFDGVTTAPTGKLLGARTDHAAIRLPTGKVLVVGGTGPTADTAELYDPAARTFTATGKLVAGRVAPSVTVLPTGDVLVAGGADPVSTAPLPSAETYDPVTERFTATGPMAIARGTIAAALLASGKVLVGGGGSTITELFNPATRTFKQTSGAMNGARSAMTATLLPSGKVLVLGGIFASGSSFPDELYDPKVDRFSPAGSTIDASRHAAILLGTGDVLTAGGVGQTHIMGRPDLDLWRADTVDAARAPKISSVTAGVRAATSVAITGQKFTSTFGPNGADTPVALFMPRAGGLLTGSIHPWTATTASWNVPSTSLTGPGMLFVAASGIVSGAAPITVEPALVGAPCAHVLDCDSGHCVDGACCDSACAGTCMTCSTGTCRAIPASADPDRECPAEPVSVCGRSGGCDGAGACARFADGTSCGPGGSCRTGVCTAARSCLDDATEQAADGSSRPCAPFRCRADACLERCASSADCTDGLQCNADQSCAPPLGDDATTPGCLCTLGRDHDRSWSLGLVALACCAALLRRRAR